jgi:dephospho-CoA kinase
VASYFQKLGAVVLEADQIGHAVLREPQVQDQLSRLWGDRVTVDGEISRSAIAKIVFDPRTGASQLAALEQITHPRIERELSRRLQELKNDNRTVAVVLDAPVMFKAGWDRHCDRIVFVESPRACRLERVLRRGWDADELDRREAAQTPVDEKRARSTDIIDNSRDPQTTFLQVVQLWKTWQLPLPQSCTEKYD